MAYKILWVDDQIADLRSHIVYLTEKGYAIEGASNGSDALEMLRNTNYDAILLDEMMPGISGLDTLAGIKKIRENVPVIMITKSEEEDLVDRAIGQRVDDYLVKPVSPIQIISALKRLLEGRKLRGEHVTKDYLSHFASVPERIFQAKSPSDWESLYEDLITWELDLYSYSDHGLLETHAYQKDECNQAFTKYIRKNYKDWINDSGDSPTLCHNMFKEKVVPHLGRGKQVFWIIIDCMRLDQWRFIEDLLSPYYHIDRQHSWSMLPSATPFARNAMFAGLTPMEIAKKYPDYWKGSAQQEHSKNAYEKELLFEQMKRLKLSSASSYRYFKVFDAQDTDDLKKQLGSLGNVELVAAVYNFLDIMSHGRSSSSILKELAPDVAAFRSLMRSWFEHSTLFEALKMISRRDATVIISTDHGSANCKKAVQVRASREASTNVRYKYGDNLGVDEKEVLLIKNPEEYCLPKQSPIENYVITTGSQYLVYPTKFHDYEKKFLGSYQHGGISMEELINPFAVLKPR
jgi:CheY-like chemotaxis protein